MRTLLHAAMARIAIPFAGLRLVAPWSHRSGARHTGAGRLRYALPVLSLAMLATSAASEPVPRLESLGVEALAETSVHAPRADASLLLQFWASHCRSCGSLFWDLDALAARHPDVAYLAVSIDAERSDALARIAEHPLYARHPARWLHDVRGALAQRLAVLVTPTLVLLDGAGGERFRHVGHLDAHAQQQLRRALLELSALRDASPSPQDADAGDARSHHSTDPEQP